MKPTLLLPALITILFGAAACATPPSTDAPTPDSPSVSLSSTSVPRAATPSATHTPGKDIPTATALPAASPWMRELALDGRVTGILETQDGGILLLANSGRCDSGAWSHRLAKLNPDGNLAWEKNFSPHCFNHARSFEDGRILLRADRYSRYLREGNPPPLTYVELNASGEVLSEHGYRTDFRGYYGGRKDSSVDALGEGGGIVPVELALSIGDQDTYEANQVLAEGYVSDGGMTLAGKTWLEPRWNDLIELWAIGIDPEREVTWKRVFEIRSREPSAVVNGLGGEDGSVLLAGVETLDSDLIWLAKFDRQGNTAFIRYYPQEILHSLPQRVVKIRHARDGGYLLLATNQVYKLDEAGDVEWVRSFYRGTIGEAYVFLPLRDFYEREGSGYMLLSDTYPNDFVALLDEENGVPGCVEILTTDSPIGSRDTAFFVEVSEAREVSVVESQYLDADWSPPNRETNESNVDIVDPCADAIPTPTGTPTPVAIPTSTPTAQPTDPSALYSFVGAPNGLILGGVRGGKWVGAEVVNQELNAGERFRVFGVEGEFLGEGQNGSPAPGVGEFCEGRPSVILLPSFDRSRLPPFRDYIGINGPWYLFPREIISIALDSPVYVAAVTDYLREAGIRDPQVRLDNALRLDIEGDGQDEVLLNASRLASGALAPDEGNYSVVLLRKIVEGELMTIPIAESVFPVDRPGEPFDYFTLVSVPDMNGDGMLEIVVRRFAEETLIYEFKGNMLEVVLSVPCSIG